MYAIFLFDTTYISDLPVGAMPDNLCLIICREMLILKGIK